MNRIQKISSYLLVIFRGLLIIIPVLFIIQWFFISTTKSDISNALNFFGIFEKTIQTPEGYINLNTVAWTPILKLLGFSAGMIGVLPFLISLFVLKAIFANYQRGEIFSVKNAILYRKLGILFLLDALLIKSLSQTLMVLAVTFTNSPGHRYLTVSFGAPNLTSLFYGMLVLLVSWVMLEASKIYEENKFTV